MLYRRAPSSYKHSRSRRHDNFYYDIAERCVIIHMSLLWNALRCGAMLVFSCVAMLRCAMICYVLLRHAVVQHWNMAQITCDTFHMISYAMELYAIKTLCARACGRQGLSCFCATSICILRQHFSSAYLNNVNNLNGFWLCSAPPGKKLFY